MGLQKISFKVPPGLWESFSKQAGSLFLARAPILNHMISREAIELAADLAGKRLSQSCGSKTALAPGRVNQLAC